MARFFLTALLSTLVALPTWAQNDATLDAHPTLVGGIAALAQEITYPDTAKADGIEGTVFIQFVVDEEGHVINPEVTRGVDPALDAEALRVTRQARFTPGRKNGEPAKVQLTLPIKFVLTAENAEDR